MKTNIRLTILFLAAVIYLSLFEAAAVKLCLHRIVASVQNIEVVR